VTMGTRRLARRLTCAAVAVAACLAASIGAADAAAAGPPSWSTPVATDSSGGLVGVSCASLSFCAAIDSTGHVTTSTSPATSAWQPLDTATGITHAPTSIACPGGAFCVAGESAGTIASSTTPSASWSEATVDTTHVVESVSCPSTGLCVAVDNNGDVLWSAAPTSGSWTAESSVDSALTLTAISCPTTSLCAAVDGHGNVFVSTTPTSASGWVSTSLGGDLTDISCNVSGLCIASSNTGVVWTTADIAPSSGPVTWTTTPLDGSGAPLAVSCIDSGLCMLVDASGVAFSSEDPTAARPTWSQTTVDQGHALKAVSCIDAGLCVAVASDATGTAISAIAAAPAATTGSGSASTQTTATLTGTLDPGDAALTSCQFEYGTTTAYGTTVPCATTPTAGGGAQAVSAQINGLSAGTTYHFALIAASAVASGGGADASFATPAAQKASPSLSGSPAVGATLTCNPNFTANGSETLAFQWLSNTTAIAGSTAPTYLVPAAEQGDHLSCAVTVAGDGGSTTVTSGFDAIPAQAGAKLAESYGGTVKRAGDSISVPVTCSPQAAASCTFTLTLTTPETVAHRTKATTVGTTTTKVSAGATRTLRVSLSAAGKRLLAQKRKLAITVALKGTLIGVLVATLETDKLTFNDAKTTRAKTTKRHHTPRRASAR
jgi:hypothetical protein